MTPAFMVALQLVHNVTMCFIQPMNATWKYNKNANSAAASCCFEQVCVLASQINPVRKWGAFTPYALFGRINHADTTPILQAQRVLSLRTNVPSILPLGVLQ